MDRLASRLDSGSADSQRNRAAMLAKIAAFEAQLALSRAGGGERYVTRHRERAKLLIRERIELLLDHDSYFLELSPLAAWGSEFTIGAAIVTGIGRVSGVECLIYGNDPTVRGGTLNPYTIRKLLRAYEIARANRLPMVQLTESGGLDLPTQAESFLPAGRIFREVTHLSGERIPTVAVVFGSSTAGGAYLPGLADYTVFIRGRSKVFLGGPPLVKMATGEETDEESLGGAEMHATVSGVADYLAESEPDAIRIARDIVEHLNWRKQGPGPRFLAEQPAYPEEELLDIVPPDLRVPFDIREVIARIVDGSGFAEFKPGYGPMLVAGWARVFGYEVGVLANNGILFSPEAQKAAQFVQLCTKQDQPILFLQNITGYMVGTQYERGGIIKDGAKMINAVANTTVPKITLMIGASYGAGNYGMAGRAYDPRFVFTWPSHQVAVMGGQQLAGVLSQVQQGSARASGRTFDPETDAAARRAIEAQVERESSALYATGQIWDDGIIDPRDTRAVLGIALSAIHSAPVQGGDALGVFRM